MLKVLLGRGLPEALISVPRAPLRNASQLAAAAGVSLMSASRLLTQLEKEGFLDKNARQLEVVRASELLRERWLPASQHRKTREAPARWIIKGGGDQLARSVARYAAARAAKPNQRPKARVCLGLFAAADALGLGFVRGAMPHLFVESLEPEVLKELGISIQDTDRHTDLYLRVPPYPEAVFRAAVVRDGLPVADVLQVWLDTYSQPARGHQQADEIRRRALAPLLGKRA
jgi:hypothetical protein